MVFESAMTPAQSLAHGFPAILRLLMVTSVQNFAARRTTRLKNHGMTPFCHAHPVAVNAMHVGLGLTGARLLILGIMAYSCSILNDRNKIIAGIKNWPKSFCTTSV